MPFRSVSSSHGEIVLKIFYPVFLFLCWVKVKCNTFLGVWSAQGLLFPVSVLPLNKCPNQSHIRCTICFFLLCTDMIFVMNNEKHFCPSKQTLICQMHQPVFLPHPLLCRNISSVLFAIVAPSCVKPLVTVCLPLTLFCEIRKYIKVGKKQMFLTVFLQTKSSPHISNGKCSSKTIPFKRSNFSSHVFFKTQCVLFLFTFFLGVFYLR